MNETALKLALKSVPVVTDNYDKVYDPVKNKTKQGVDKLKSMRNNDGRMDERSDYSEYEYDRPPRRARTERHRYPSRRPSPRGDLVESRHLIQSGNGGRAKSLGRGERRRGSRRDYSDSEASLSPPRRNGRRKSLGEKALVALGLGGVAATADKSQRRSRSRSRARPRDRNYRYRRSPSREYDDSRYNRSLDPPSYRNYERGYYDDRTPARYKPAGYIANGDRDSDRGGPGSQIARRNNQSDVARNNNNNNSSSNRRRDSSSSSSNSSSDVCSSSEDERRTRKVRGKEYLTAGLAAVATIHAARGVYSSMEARDKRNMELYKGEISPEEAKRQKNKNRLQDAAAIGIAALGIKGAYSEWQDVQESRHELNELQKEKAQRHEKRLKKAEKMDRSRDDRGDQYRGRNRSEPDLNRKRRDY